MMIQNERSVSYTTLALFILQCISLIMMFLMASIRACSVISIIQMFMLIIAVKEKTGRFFTFINIFLLLSYILHFGNIVPVSLFGYEDYFLISEKEDIIISSIMYVAVCHIALIYGTIINHKEKSMTNFIDIDFKLLNKLGYLCFVIGIVPKIWIDYQQVTSQMAGGYLSSLEQIIQYGPINIFAQFFYPGALLLMFTSNGNVLRGRIILISACVLEVFSMMSGGRIYAISFIISLIYVYYIRVSKPDFKTVMMGTVALLFFSSVMTVIAFLRRSGAFSLETIILALGNFESAESALMAFSVEMGGTMLSVMYSIMTFESLSDFGYGISYIDTMLYMSSMIREHLDRNHLFYIYNFSNSAYMGGSWLGEAFYNFGWLSPVFCFFIGKAIGGFENVFAEDEKKNNYLRTLLILIFIYPLIFYIRDYFVHFSTSIQVALVVIFLSYFIKKIKISI